MVWLHFLFFCSRLMYLSHRDAEKVMKKFMMIATILVAMSFSGVKAQNNKHSVGIETSYNFLKAGIGARYGYDFTNILRFTIDGTYYLTSSRSLDVYKGTSKT